MNAWPSACGPGAAKSTCALIDRAEREIYQRGYKQHLGPIVEYKYKSASGGLSCFMSAAVFWTDYIRATYLEQRTLQGFLNLEAIKLGQIFWFYWGIWLLIPLVALRPALRRPWTRFALWPIGLVILGLIQVFGLMPHYSAPVACLLVLLAVEALRQLRLWRWHDRPSGQRLVAGMAVCYPLLAVLSMVLDRGIPSGAAHLQRAALQAALEREGGRHLVVVRYVLPRGLSHDEWVWNAADIDGSPVVWAREMSPAQDRQLVAYFADRRTWLLEIDEPNQQARLLPHPLRRPHSLSVIAVKQ